MKFKKGDLVRAVKDVGKITIGKIGMVSSTLGGCPYAVNFSDAIEYCFDDELEPYVLNPLDIPSLVGAALTAPPPNPSEPDYMAIAKALQGDHPYRLPVTNDEAMSAWIDLRRFCKEEG